MYEMPDLLDDYLKREKCYIHCVTITICISNSATDTDVGTSMNNANNFA